MWWLLACAPRVAPAPPLPPLLPAGCDRPELVLSVDQSPVALGCSEGLDRCSASVELTVRACASAVITGYTLDPAPGLTAPVGGTPATVPTGGSWSAEVWLTEAGTFRIGLLLGVEAGQPVPDFAPVDLVVTNPALDAALASCQACGGRWEPLGLAQIPGCVCPTRDAGKPCRRPDECEAGCVSRDGEPFHCQEESPAFGCFQYRPAGAGPGEVYEMCAD